jgi:hypothetical protein
MKTTFKTLICTALCCAASSAFAAPAPTTTAIAFKGAAGCTGPNVGSVSLSGNTNPDVYVQSTTTTSSGPATSGVAQLQIATDANGKPTSTANQVCWVRVDSGAGQAVDSNGQACFPVDLDNLANLGLNCNGMALQNVTCPTGPIGFRVHYIGQSGVFHESFSTGTDLTINCEGVCGTNTDFTIGLALASGPGNPCPGSTQCWDYTISVQNCTATDLTNVKIQGGTAGWLNQAMTTATSDVNPQPTVKPVGNGKNTVITWTGNMPKGSEVNITVHVCGTVAKTDGTTEFLNGPWSAKGTDPVGNHVTTGYTGQLSIVTDSTNCGP